MCNFDTKRLIALSLLYPFSRARQGQIKRSQEASELFDRHRKEYWSQKRDQGTSIAHGMHQERVLASSLVSFSCKWVK